MLQTKYKFIDSIGVLPRIVSNALEYIGTHETPGKQSTPEIMRMADHLNIADLYVNDETAWCALFMCYILSTSNKPMPYKGFEILRAMSFAGEGPTHPVAYGKQVAFDDMCLGDIVVLKRLEGGHVGILIAVTKRDNKITSVHLLGGNQSNAVNVSEMNAQRVHDIRRYYATRKPDSAKQYIMQSSGEMSVNER